ncbi:MAG: hypothetical protein NWT08_14905 [Akkermansiaceae bacterium]|jgi:hypothetical protein|nr:hypothetical protein [Akkermansiaceae bacterium]MDP4646603.1 hypothetical protein [Akkermansiaceae bacterium]MDP4720198.1 hypothetical protein [Akkermansiaceae bacterium]MDP4779812.1 hypothetical protein [Akkermansiaceae bacterium]MDP4846400.1 hypothetical protein [Akkermansiaceae bacterium]
MANESKSPITSAAAVGLSLLTGVILVAPTVVSAITGPPDDSKIPDDPKNNPGEGSDAASNDPGTHQA